MNPVSSSAPMAHTIDSTNTADVIKKVSKFSEKTKTKIFNILITLGTILAAAAVGLGIGFAGAAIDVSIIAGASVLLIGFVAFFIFNFLRSPRLIIPGVC